MRESSTASDTGHRRERRSQASAADRAPDFHGAAIVTGDGRELPITETMLRDAFEKLESASRGDFRA